MNTEKTIKEKKHITLKEAAEISGYAPDYIGQLIRKGKISGEQVYSSVAWVTTEAAVRAYLKEAKLRKDGIEENNGFWRRAAVRAARIRHIIEFTALARALLWIIIIVAVCFTLILFYVFSVSFEKKLERQSLERALQKSGAVDVASPY